MPHQNKKICPSVSEQMFGKASRLNASCFGFGRGGFRKICSTIVIEKERMQSLKLLFVTL